jgi:hypothetical protein
MEVAMQRVRHPWLVLLLTTHLVYTLREPRDDRSLAESEAVGVSLSVGGRLLRCARPRHRSRARSEKK